VALSAGSQTTNDSRQTSLYPNLPCDGSATFVDIDNPSATTANLQMIAMSGWARDAANTISAVAIGVSKGDATLISRPERVRRLWERTRLSESGLEHAIGHSAAFCRGACAHCNGLCRRPARMTIFPSNDFAVFARAKKTVTEPLAKLIKLRKSCESHTKAELLRHAKGNNSDKKCSVKPFFRTRGRILQVGHQPVKKTSRHRFNDLPSFFPIYRSPRFPEPVNCKQQYESS
jgi:hypothetical protein